MVSDRLLKIKKWIGLDEAAERLSSIVEGNVTVLDLIELGLSHDLILSVRLPYGEKFVGREMIYKEVPIINHLQEMFLFRLMCDQNLKSVSEEDLLLVHEEEFKQYLLDDFESSKGRMSARYGSKYEGMTLESYLEKGRFGDYEYVAGPEYLNEVIYDLPMIGAEVLDLQRLYSTEKGYESKGLINLNGPFIKDINGRLINIMEEFEQGKITKDKNGNMRRLELDATNYFPADGLPVYSEIGLRPENLIVFERTITGTSDVDDMDFCFLVGSMLSVIKNTNSKQRRWTQDLLKEELVDMCPNFTRRALDDYFAVANKKFKEKFN